MPKAYSGWNNPLRDNPVPGDVPACLYELGIQVKRVDSETREVVAWCPAHFKRVGKQDRHPSWSVHMDEGLHNCFSCGFAGTFVDLVEEVLSCSRDEAVAWVKSRGSIERARRKLTGETIGELQAEEITEADLALFKPVPEEECEKRMIDPDVADHYGVLWDAGRGAWITPVREPHTFELLGWQEKKGHKFKNHPEHLRKRHTLFGLQQYSGTVVTLVESPLDVLRIASAGIPGALSSMGRNVTDLQLELISENCEVLVCALDNDNDGEQSARDLQDRCKRYPMRLNYWCYGDSEAKDPGEQTDAEIRYGYEHAVSSLVVVW